MPAVARLGEPAILVGLAQAAGHLLVAPTGAAALAASVLAASVLAGVLAVVLTIGGRPAGRGAPGPPGQPLSSAVRNYRPGRDQRSLAPLPHGQTMSWVPFALE